MEVATTKFIIPELEQYWDSVWVCPYLDSLLAVYLWQSDLNTAYENGMLGTGARVPKSTVIFCTFALEDDAWNASDPKLACFWAWVHYSQMLYAVHGAADQAISLHQKGLCMVALAQLWADSWMASSPGPFPEVGVYLQLSKFLHSLWGRIPFQSIE